MSAYAHLRQLHTYALSDCSRFLPRITGADLGRPTPCTEWDLQALLAHVLGQNDGFAVAVRSGNAGRDAYAGPVIEAATLVDDVDRTTRRLVEAFADADPAQDVHLVEPGITVTVGRALRMQLLDTIVHTWDIATALGAEYRPSTALTEFVHPYAATIAARPGGTPGVFSAPLEVTGDLWVDALRLLGREAALSRRRT